MLTLEARRGQAAVWTPTLCGGPGPTAHLQVLALSSTCSLAGLRTLLPRACLSGSLAIAKSELDSGGHLSKWSPHISAHGHPRF